MPQQWCVWIPHTVLSTLENKDDDVMMMIVGERGETGMITKMMMC